MRAFRALSKIGIRDWAPARWVNHSSAIYPEQVRLYSTGYMSAMMVISKGAIVAVDAALEDFEQGKPLGVIWDRVVPHLKPGVGVLYFGGVDNIVECIPAERMAKIDRRGDGRGARDVSAHGKWAHTEYKIAGDKMHLVVRTRIAPDLLSSFTYCAEKRVPVDIIDELSASLAILESIPEHAVEGVAVSLIIFEHLIYTVVHVDNTLMKVSETTLRTGSSFDPPEYLSVVDNISSVLAYDPQSHHVSADVRQVLVCDATSRMADASWREPFEQAAAAAYPNAEVVVKLPPNLGLSVIESHVPSATSTLGQVTQFPLPLLAFMPTLKGSK